MASEQLYAEEVVVIEWFWLASNYIWFYLGKGVGCWVTPNNALFISLVKCINYKS
jgi:hypothetical protein